MYAGISEFLKAYGSVIQVVASIIGGILAMVGGIAGALSFLKTLAKERELQRREEAMEFPDRIKVQFNEIKEGPDGKQLLFIVDLAFSAKLEELVSKTIAREIEDAMLAPAKEDTSTILRLSTGKATKQMYAEFVGPVGVILSRCVPIGIPTGYSFCVHGEKGDDVMHKMPRIIVYTDAQVVQYGKGGGGQLSVEKLDQAPRIRAFIEACEHIATGLGINPEIVDADGYVVAHRVRNPMQAFAATT